MVRGMRTLTCRFCQTLPFAVLLGGCGFSPFLRDLSWAVAKDLGHLLPFSETATEIVKALAGAVLDANGAPRGKNAEGRVRGKDNPVRIGLTGFLSAVGGEADIGVAGRFLPDYLAQQLGAAGPIEVTVLDAEGLGDRVAKTAQGVALRGDQALSRFDYLLAGVVDPRPDRVGVSMKLYEPRADGKTLDFNGAAALDPDALALLGRSHVITPLPGAWVKCAQDPAPVLTAKAKAAAEGKCSVSLREGPSAALCVTCGGGGLSAPYTTTSGALWQDAEAKPFSACVSIKPALPGAAPYALTAAGAVRPSGGASGELPETALPLLTARQGEEYEVKLAATPLYHTGTLSPRTLSVYLAVDGVNSLGEDLTLPSVGSRRLFPAGGDLSVLTIPGWQKDETLVRRFKFVSFENAVAVRLGKEENVGQITALLYAEPDRGCPEGDLCQPTYACPGTDVTPVCRCLAYQKQEVSCEEAVGVGGCEKFTEYEGKAKGAKAPVNYRGARIARATDAEMRTWRAEQAREAWLEAHPRGGAGGGSGISAAGGGGVGGGGGGGGGSMSAPRPMAAAAGERLGTGEGHAVRERAKTQDATTAAVPFAVLTVHYRGAGPSGQASR